MSRPNRQRAVGGWLAVVVLAWLTPAAGLGQAKTPEAKEQDKPQKAPTSQPATQPATQAKSQPAATDAADRYWALQEQAASSKPASSKPATQPARRPTGEQPPDRPSDRKDLKRRAQLSTQGAEPGLERKPPAGAPRSVGPRDLGRSVQPSTRGRSVRPPTARQEQEPAQVTSKPTRLDDLRPTVPPEAEVEPQRPAKPEDERTEWFVFDGMPWEDVIVQIARRIGKPLMTESYDLPTGELTYISSRKFTKQEAIDELQFLLYDQGFYFLETENYVYVVRLADVHAKLPLEYVYSSLEEFERANPRDMQYVIVYIDVGDERAAEDLCDAFSSFFVGGDLPIVPPGTNQVKITALARDVRKFEELRRRIKLDKQDIRRTKVYKFKTNARDIERILRDQLGLAQPTRRYDPQQRRFVTEGAEGDIRITADDRTNTLIIRAKPEDFEEIARFFEETKIDEIADIGEFKTTVIEIQHANAQEIADLLNQIFQQEQGQTTRFRVPTQPQRRTSDRGRTTSRTPQQQPQQPTPQDIIVEDIYERAKKTVRLFAHEPTNSLIVYANEEGLGRVREMLKDIDQPTPSNFRTFKLEHAEAEQIHGVVEQIARGMGAMGARGRAALVVLDTTNNALHVIADREEMTRIEAIVKELDIPGPAEERHVVELENIAPSRVAQIVLPLLDSAGGGGPRMPGRRGRSVRTTATPQVIPLDEAGILIVFCSDEEWSKVEETIRLWDSNAISNTPEIKSFAIENGNAQTISNTLQMFYRTYTHPTLGRSPVFMAAEGETIYVQAIQPALEEIEALVKSMDIESAGKPLVILPLQHADAVQVSQYAQPLLDQPGGRGRFVAGGNSVVPEPVTNSLIIRADKTTLERITAFAKEMDEKVGGQLPERKFYTPRYGQPQAIASAVQQIYGGGGRFGGRSVGTQVKAVVVGDQVVVEAPKDKLAEIDTFVAQLDDPKGREITIRTIKMAGADVNQIAAKLNSAFSIKARQQSIVARFDADPSSETILLTYTKDVEAELEQLLKEYEEAYKPMITKVEFRELHHAQASEVAPQLRDQLVTAITKQYGRSAAQQIVVSAEPRTNRVIINAPQVAVDLAVGWLEQYDVPAPEAPVSPVDTKTYKLPGLDVNTLARSLTQIFANKPPRPDRLRSVFAADPVTETILVSAPKDEFAEIDQRIAEYQAETADLTPEQKFVVIQNADANYIAGQVSNLLSQQLTRTRGADVARRVSITVDSRLNRLVINAPKFVIPMAESLIAELDQVMTAEGQIHTIPLENADAGTVVGILNNVLRDRMRQTRTLQISVEPMTNSLIVSANKEDFAEIEKWAKELDEQAVTARGELKIVDLMNANPWEVLGILNAQFAPRRGQRDRRGQDISFSIIAGRSLVVQAPAEKMAEIEELATRLDQIKDEVEVRSYELLGIGNQVYALAAQVANAVNSKIGERERRVTITPYPQADTMIVTARTEQFPEIEAMMEKFKGL
ncbi:MAG TPA: secretin N-terminal domain-containing protein, partial [Phycisphaerae bacterium]|nr:secretin N-terminal domain-containing protein [Phycisphaerae bacterium]